MTWFKQLQHSLDETKGDAASRFVQLATVSSDNKPRVRTLVCREITSDHIIVVATDLRSDKFNDLKHCHYGELCWYFTESREQYRFVVEASWRSGEEARALWETMSDATRQQFFGPTPGKSVVSADEKLQRIATSSPPEHFCELRLNVAAVDYLDVSQSPNIRVNYTREQGTWKSRQIVP